MTKILRIAAVAALTLSTTPAFAAPVGPDPSSRNATATVVIKKPLTLTWVQDLDLGEITIVDGAVSSTVGLTWDGTWSCPTAGVSCSGTHQPAKYKVTGVNNTVVTINTNNVSLTNPAPSSTPLLMTVSSPGTVSLGNSGISGKEFSLGGSVTVNGSTVEGTYSGTFDVTVNY
jgi:hypothetical protein